MELKPIEFPRPVLEVLADLTVRLVELRQNECKHLCIENVAPELWGALLQATYPPPPMIVSSDGLHVRLAVDGGSEHG